MVQELHREETQPAYVSPQYAAREEARRRAVASGSAMRERMLRRAWRLALLAGLLAALAGGYLFYAQADAASFHEAARMAALKSIGGKTFALSLAAMIATFVGTMIWSSVGGATGAVMAFGLGAVTATGTHVALRQAGLGTEPSRYEAELAALAAPAKNEADAGEAQTSRTAFELASLPADTAGTRRDEAERLQMLSAADRYTGPSNNDILLLGMNPGPATAEARKLRSVTNVTLITDGPRQDHIKIGSKNYDLRSNLGIIRFAESLGLSELKTNGVVAALQACDKQARDEMAQLAVVWARVEKGQRKLPSRLILGGHSNGDGVWGDNNGSLRLGPLHKLAQALPKAAAQVEDFFITGCYSGGELTMEQYRLIFPQLATIWAYESQAPSADGGAIVQQAVWEKFTRGESTNVDRRQAGGMRRENVATWTLTRGYDADTPPLDVNALRGKVQWLEKYAFSPAFNGKPTTRIDGWAVPIEITDPYTGLVRQYYGWLVRLSQDKDLPDHERPLWIAKKHQTIRLLYYNATVAPRFTQQHAAAIRTGYAAVGLTPPDYAHLRRGAALKEIRAFALKVKSTPRAKPEAKKLLQLLQRGLWNLDPEVIPDGWV